MILPFIKKTFSSKNRVKIVAIAKDEAAYLSSWIFHHLHFGFDAIDIYINNTTDNTQDFKKAIYNLKQVNFIDADTYFQGDTRMSQRNIYREAFYNSKKNGYSHVLFLDIDEFWTPCDFKASIHDCIESLPFFNVLAFEWLNKHCEQEFSSPYVQKLNGELAPLMKSLVSTRTAVTNFRIHTVETNDDSVYLLADGKKPIFSSTKIGQLKQKSESLKPFFILHRLYRSEMEYISLLGRGNPESAGTENQLLKDNRNGYFANREGKTSLILDKDLLNKYENKYETWIDRHQLMPHIKKSRTFIENRFNSVLITIQKGNPDKKDLFRRLLANVTLPAVLESQKLFLQNIEAQDKSIMNKQPNTKIFQIGFNKTGTGSLHTYFEKNGIKSIHWDNGKLSRKIFENFNENRSLFFGYEDYQAYTDMEHREGDNNLYASEEYFEAIYHQNKNALFVLNIRPIDDWITSRLNHGNGEYLARTMRHHNLTRDEVIKYWRERYYTHIANVTTFFSGRDNFMLFDISRHTGTDLTNFFNKHGFEFDEGYWGHHHKTQDVKKNKNIKNKKEKVIDNIRDASLHLYNEADDKENAIKLMRVASQLRPDGLAIKKFLQEWTTLDMVNNEEDSHLSPSSSGTNINQP